MNDPDKVQGVYEDYDTVFGGINQLTKELHNLDERGLILSLAAFAEDALGSLLKAFMLPNDAAHQLLDGFNAPLGTFSSRIKAAYALGLITKEQFTDLEHLRKIRNDFSHTWRPITFSDQRITGHIKAINYSHIHDEFPETHVEKVRTALSSLLIEIQVTISQIEKKGHRVQVIGDPLVRGFPGDFEQQIEAARTEVHRIKKELSSAVGERRDFFALAIERWALRFYFIVAGAPLERRTELEALRTSLLVEILMQPENRDLLSRFKEIK